MYPQLSFGIILIKIFWFGS